MSKILNVDQAVQFLCVSKATIYSWVHQKRIPYRKHGRKLAFAESELELWSHNNRIEIFIGTNIHPFTNKSSCYTGSQSFSSLKTKEYGAKDHRRTAIGGNPFDEEGGTS